MQKKHFTHRYMKVGDLFVADIGGGFHRYVVVGKNASSSNMLLLVMATSKIQNRKQHVQRAPLTVLESLIEVQVQEYQSIINSERCTLTKPTCFDCNSPYPINELIMQDYTQCDPVSAELLKKLKNALRCSPAVDQHMKETYEI